MTDRELLEAADREMFAMQEALVGGRSTMEAFAAIVGVESSPEFDAAVKLNIARAQQMAREAFAGAGEAGQLLAGFNQGLGFAAAILRVQARETSS